MERKKKKDELRELERTQKTKKKCRTLENASSILHTQNQNGKKKKKRTETPNSESQANEA